MSSLKDVSGIPTEGKDLIIVTAVNNVLHFRIFDGDGKLVVDSDEKRLTEQARQIGDLRKQLESLWPHHELTRSDKDRIISAVKSIIDHKHYYLWIPAPWIRRSVDGLEVTEDRPGGDAQCLRDLRRTQTLGPELLRAVGIRRV